MELNMERYNESNWNSATLDEKKQALIDLNKYYADKEHRPECDVKFVSLDSRIAGQYVDKDKTLYINEALLTNKSVDRYEIIDTVIHEGKHAYQHYVVDNNRIDLESQETINKWKEDQIAYIENGENIYKYRYQAVESDAFSFAEKEMEINFEHMPGEEASYQTYKQNMNKGENDLLKGVQKLYPNQDYEQSIGNEVHKRYEKIMELRNKLQHDLETINANKSPSNNKIDIDKAIMPTKIGDLRKTLNAHMDEIIAQHTDLSQQRDQVKGAPLTKEQAEKLAASNHLNGADKELDKQAQELQAKQDKLSQYKEDTMKYGKENGLDTTLWRHAPEIFKGEGLKYYESSMATVENNTKVFDRQATEIQAKREQIEARLQTPEARSEIAKNSEEILAQDKERLAKLGALDQQQNELTNEKRDIIKLRDVIPSRKLERTIDIQGDAKDVQNLLSQTDQIKQQATEMQQAQSQSCGQGLSL